MYTTLSDALQRPPVFAPNTEPFWDDEHISAQMLRAHLDPDFEGASRKRDFIDRSARWIHTIAPPSRCRDLFDVGCGPGLYAERFAEMGYRVTGVDLSRRSIAHAAQSAQTRQLDIAYRCENYLRLGDSEAFDLAVMIYCDYGALAGADRQTLLGHLHRALRPGGLLLLDVFSAAKYESFPEGQTWTMHPAGGFWSASPHLTLQDNARYPGNVTLEQTLVVTDGDTKRYRLWNQCFTVDALRAEVGAAGFAVREVFGDVAGAPATENEETIALLLEK